MARRNPYYDGPPTGNFDGLRFFNPGEPPTDRSFAEILRWRREGNAAPWPRDVPVTPAVPAPRVSGLRATMVGHATLLIQAAGLNVLTDPVWSDRASPFRHIGPRRATPPGIALASLPPIDVVLLSHNHYDHLDIATLRTLHQRYAPLIVTPLGNDAIVRRHIPTARLATGNWGDGIDLTGDASVHFVPANHWSARGIRDRRMALWSGFMLRTSAGLVYFAGDTGYGTGRIFPAIHARHGPPDLALIPIGAYAPEWFMAAQHCNPEDAVRIFQAVGARQALGIHWGTFRLTDEPREEPCHRLSAALARADIDAARFAPAVPGQAWEIAEGGSHSESL